LRRPVFSDFKFLLVGNTQVTMKMKYYWLSLFIASIFSFLEKSSFRYLC
jgi:hypothetical protein